ncbi:MAG TPA: NAD(P)-dependent oxidoreductase [Acidimicrobiia bacterium]|nr:NAD(P)-dependent oxidoreductase [Acidimicrobiia bacterium]
MEEGAVLVTGALGCIGAWTVRELVMSDVPVVAFDRSTDPRRLRQITTQEQFERVRLIQGDLTDLANLQETIVANEVDRVVHLGALQIPFCRADPPLGALVNVVGTVNVFEAARRAGIPHIVYTSSIAVFDWGPERGRLTVDAPARPVSHYGAYKLANEGTARAYWADFGVSSIGIRPMTVYGPGRDQGLTSSPTRGILAAVLGHRYEIGFGGFTLFHYAGDVGRALAVAANTPGAGAHVVNLNGVRAPISNVVASLHDLVGSSAEGITVGPNALPFPDDVDTSGLDIIGPPSVTPLNEGIAATVEFFRDLQSRGALEVVEHGLVVGDGVVLDRESVPSTE